MKYFCLEKTYLLKPIWSICFSGIPTSVIASIVTYQEEEKNQVR